LYAVYVFILNDEFEYVGVTGIKGKVNKDGVSGRIWDHVSEPLIQRYLDQYSVIITRCLSGEAEALENRLRKELKPFINPIPRSP